MRIKPFALSTISLLFGACQLPDPISPSHYSALCSASERAVAGDPLMVTMRLPDCRSGALLWSTFRSPSLEYGSFALDRYPLRIQPSAFWEELRRQVADRGAPLIYIHGYRNSTEDANRRAVAIQAAALGNRPVVSIVWPSYDQTTKYFWDEANNEWAREHLRETIVAVARLHRKTDIIAHSMGNRILLDVLSSLGGESVVNNVIMAAPDVDRDLLQHLLARPQGLGAKTTVYASLKDQALASSWRMHGHPRAGDLARGAGSDQPATDLYLKVNRADIVDTSAVRPTFVGHADFIETIQGAKDLCLTINANDSEPLGTREPSAATNHWVLRVSPTPSPNCDPAADQAVKIANGK